MVLASVISHQWVLLWGEFKSLNSNWVRNFLGTSWGLPALKLVVLFAIPLLAIWLASVNYQHWPVGISGWYYWLCFVALLRFGGNSFFKKIGRNSYIPQKGGYDASKRGRCPSFEWKRGFRQIYNTKMYHPSFPLVTVGKVPRKYQPIPTKNTKSLNNSTNLAV